MSQRNLERVIGQLATDDGFRRRFIAAPRATLQDLIDRGVELNRSELGALMAIDSDRLQRFADSLPPCIQKVESKGGRP